MKKIFFLTVASLTLLTSCTKDWTCTCTYANGLPGYTEDYAMTTKKDAQAKCDDEQYTGKSCKLN